MKEFEGIPVLARAVARIIPFNAEIEDAVCELLLTKRELIISTEIWDEKKWEPSGYKKLLAIHRSKIIAIEKYLDKTYNDYNDGILEVRYYTDENKIEKVHFNEFRSGAENLIKIFKKESDVSSWLIKHW